MIEVDVVTLDSLDLPDGVMLKLDLEGYEQQALEGASRTLKHTKLVEVELSLLPSYKTPWRPVLERLERDGFMLVGVEPGFTDWQTGRVVEMDATFERL